MLPASGVHYHHFLEWKTTLFQRIFNKIDFGPSAISSFGTYADLMDIKSSEVLTFSLGRIVLNATLGRDFCSETHEEVDKPKAPEFT